MRRLGTIAAAAAVALLAGCTASPAPASGPTAAAGPDHPNVVFVLTDDLSMNLVASMPHVQALQRAGTTMSRFSVVDSLCCPSRTATFTGEYPHDDGVFTNTGDDGGYDAFQANHDAQRTYAVALQHAGYRTAMMGKYLNGYQPTDPVPPGWDEWDVAGNGYGEFDYDLNQNGTVHHYGRSASDYLTDVVAGKGADFIRSSAKAGQAFALEVATFAPHGPSTPAPRDKGSAAGTPYPKTEAYDTLPSNPPTWLRDRKPLTSQQQRRITTAYDKRVASVQAVDDLIGKLQATLAETGQAKDTYVVFNSDNGFHMGEYRLMPGKQTAFDTDIHVPLVVAGPGVPAGATRDELVSNIDLAPTFESLAGAKADPRTDGVSMADLWHGRTVPDWQPAVLVEHHGPANAKGDPDRQGRARANPPSYEAIRTADALYVRYGSGEEEYYDTRSDPQELHNLGSAGVPDAMRTTLQALVACHGATACQAAARSAPTPTPTPSPSA